MRRRPLLASAWCANCVSSDTSTVSTLLHCVDSCLENVYLSRTRRTEMTSCELAAATSSSKTSSHHQLTVPSRLVARRSPSTSPTPPSTRQSGLLASMTQQVSVSSDEHPLFRPRRASADHSIIILSLQPTFIRSHRGSRRPSCRPVTWPRCLKPRSLRPRSQLSVSFSCEWRRTGPLLSSQRGRTVVVV